jgi:hypothetical protein
MCYTNNWEQCVILIMSFVRKFQCHYQVVVNVEWEIIQPLGQ